MNEKPERSRERRRATTVSAAGSASSRELIVVARQAVSLRVRRNAVASASGASVRSLSQLLAARGVALQPLFGASVERTRAGRRTLAGAAPSGAPDLSIYYRVAAPDERLDALAEEFRGLESIEAAYVKPPAELPSAARAARSARSTGSESSKGSTRSAGGAGAAPSASSAQPPNTMAAIPDEPPAQTPDYSPRQGYLDPAPAGIDARHAWTIAGGRGAGVGIVDIEGAWRFTHEDLLQNQGGVVGGTPSSDLGWRNHGTAVVGVIGGDSNASGVTGVCPDAHVRAISIFGGLGSAAAIRQAADMLVPGDVLLIELHRAGPRFAYQQRDDQLGYIAIEWWPDDFDAIRYATSRGIVVVEAAGNGAQDLDDVVYDARPAGFPATWTNPYRRSNRDSGAILVGAGAPPPGTHGRDHGPDRSRLEFSNWGASLDAQGWGREVTTCGYGDLQGGPDEDEWYTDQFSGTSSASPIVVGALACVQGILRARGAPALTPAQARALLRGTGSPQQDAPGRPASQRIGNRPDLRQLAAQQAAADTVPLHRYWNGAIGDHFYTTNWNELGAGGHGWTYEGVAAHVLPQQRPGTVPLYRYWNGAIGDHVYTTNWDELGSGRYGYVYDGIQCYVHPSPAAQTVPLYRYWNGAIGDHFYTVQWTELGAGRWGYAYEGIQCHVYAQPASVPAAPVAPAAVDGGGAGAIPSTFRMSSAPAPAAEAVPGNPPARSGGGKPRSRSTRGEPEGTAAADRSASTLPRLLTMREKVDSAGKVRGRGSGGR